MLSMALNVTKRLDNGIVPWEARYGEQFTGMLIPFGARVLYWKNPKQNVPSSAKFAATGVEGIFLGYHIQPGFIWKEEYLVTPVKDCGFAIEIGNFPILRSKRMESGVAARGLYVPNEVRATCHPGERPQTSSIRSGLHVERQ